MKEFVIVTDSSCDLSKEYRAKHGIDYARMLLNWVENEEDKEVFADLDWEEITEHKFYSLQKDDGIRIRTSLITVEEYCRCFEGPLKEGKDVLYIACSSGLSASINIGRNAYETILKDKYPNNKVVIVDSLRAGMSQGQIIMDSVALKDEGKSLEEIEQYILENRLKYWECGFPDSLLYLKRAGRVKASSAFFANLLGIKPILLFDDLGGNLATEKVKGKKKAMQRLGEIVVENIADDNKPIYIMHAECAEEDLNYMEEVLKEKIPGREIVRQVLGPIIGASSGPGTLIINFKGK